MTVKDYFAEWGFWTKKMLSEGKPDCSFQRAARTIMPLLSLLLAVEYFGV
jgi:hypothetical protein